MTAGGYTTNAALSAATFQQTCFSSPALAIPDPDGACPEPICFKIPNVNFQVTVDSPQEAPPPSLGVVEPATIAPAGAGLLGLRAVRRKGA